MTVLASLASALQAATDFSFSDATLVVAGAKTINAQGSVTAASVSHACRAKLDQKTIYVPEVGAVLRSRLIISAKDLAATPTKGNRLTLGGVTYTLGVGGGDGIGSHYSFEALTDGT